MIPTSTNITIDVQPKLPAQTEAVIVFLAEGGRICGDAPHLLDDKMLNIVERLIKAGVARGKQNEILFDLIDADTARGKARRVFLAGVGKPDEIDQESIRQSAGAIAKAVRKHRIGHLTIIPPVLKDLATSGAESAVTGLLLASFDYEEYHGAGQKKDEEDRPKKIAVTF